jgi:hypothetical protein
VHIDYHISLLWSTVGLTLVTDKLCASKVIDISHFITVGLAKILRTFTLTPTQLNSTRQILVLLPTILFNFISFNLFTAIAIRLRSVSAELKGKNFGMSSIAVRFALR